MIRIVFRPASCLASCVVALAALVVTPGTAVASFVQDSSRATFDSSGSFIPVDWGVFGPASTWRSSTPASETVGGLSIGVASSQGVLARADEGTDFFGDFAVGDHLLRMREASWTAPSSVLAPRCVASAPRSIPTTSRARSAGWWMSSAAPTLCCLPPTTRGSRRRPRTIPAPFVGVVSSVPDISFAVFLINQPNPDLPPQSGAVGINRLDVLTAVPGTGVADAAADRSGCGRRGAPARLIGPRHRGVWQGRLS